MPAWGQVLLGIAAVLTAVGIIWQKAVKPMLIGANRAEEMYRMQVQFHETFRDAPQLLSVMRDIAHEFRNNNGSTLRDVVDRIHEASQQALVAARELEIKAEAQERIAERDREQMRRFEVLIDRLEQRLDRAVESTERIESAAAAVAENLAESHHRAEQVEGEPGAAADAAVREGES